MKTALIAVDVQNDFLPGGALPVADGDRIIQPLLNVARDCHLVIASRDWHPADHVSFRLAADKGGWPTHCVQDTKGAKIHPKILKRSNFVVSKGTDPEREAYSAFDGGTLRPIRSLEQILRDQGVQRVIVGGLTLEYCVRFTALDANALGFDTIVPLNCTAALDEEGRASALTSFERAGVHVVPNWSH